MILCNYRLIHMMINNVLKDHHSWLWMWHRNLWPQTLEWVMDTTGLQPRSWVVPAVSNDQVQNSWLFQKKIMWTSFVRASTQSVAARLPLIWDVFWGLVANKVALSMIPRFLKLKHYSQFYAGMHLWTEWLASSLNQKVCSIIMTHAARPYTVLPCLEMFPTLEKEQHMQLGFNYAPMVTWLKVIITSIEIWLWILLCLICFKILLDGYGYIVLSHHYFRVGLSCELTTCTSLVVRIDPLH